MTATQSPALPRALRIDVDADAIERIDARRRAATGLRAGSAASALAATTTVCAALAIAHDEPIAVLLGLGVALVPAGAASALWERGGAELGAARGIGREALAGARGALDGAAEALAIGAGGLAAATAGALVAPVGRTRSLPVDDPTRRGARAAVDRVLRVTRTEHGVAVTVDPR